MKIRFLTVAVLAVAMVLGACQSAPEDATETVAGLPSTAPMPSGSHAMEVGDDDGDDADGSGEETSVFDLERGDCFSASGDEVETVTVVDCQEPHIYEVFAVFDHEAGEDEAYPGAEEILEFADAACQPLFEDYVGTDYESSGFWITSVTPSEQTWDEGDDREIVCALKLGEEGTETTGSAEGSGE